MKKYFSLCLLAIMILTAPFLVGAATYSTSTPTYSEYNHGLPAIIPSEEPDIIFPIQGGAQFVNDFGDGRSGGRVHEANDLMAPKMTPILAARGGRVISAAMTEPSYGFMISIAGDDGYTYNYLHINNDTPDTDDGLGGAEYAYAPGISRGVTVVQGQHIAWVGDSGNAESTGSHLHFEIRLPDDTAINPYQYLNAALQIYTYNPSAAQNDSPTINHDKGLVVTEGQVTYCTPGSLIRIETNSSVYYCGANGKRFVFPNAQTYATWYADFSKVETISAEAMSKLPLGGNVTYRPGVKLVKIQTDPRVYAVDHNGTLRLMVNPTIATKYYGANWNKKVEDIPDAFFTTYTVGKPITN